MDRPVVCIVGRPNVGKSTLFNRIVGKRIAITEDKPGVTRDRIYGEAEWLNKYFTLIDTGGLEPLSEDIFLSEIKRQVEIAVETADVILFVVDGKEGIISTDKEIGNLLRKSGKKILLVCNKVDTHKTPNEIFEFYELGLGEPIIISASQGLGIGDLLDETIKNFPENKDTEYNEDIIKVAVVGKPNVGKSSLINYIIGEERVIVTNIPGTTRDAIDTFLTYEDEDYLFIDTAGLRRKKKIYENVERYSVIRTLSAVDRSDICVLVIDGTEGVTEQDAKIAGYAYEQGKACIIAVNKWDAVDKKDSTYLQFERDIRTTLSFIPYAPIIFISAKTGQRVQKLFSSIKEVFHNYTFRVTTGLLNDIINEAVLLNQPPTDKGKRLKIFYGTQIGTKPPRFLIFINSKKLLHFSYERYLENQLRQYFGFEGTPIKFEFREKGD
ncbi:MAG TPA: ribosome biogenesis GTPase Der [Tissierellales bacterium]|nr:ribosome biogenesis GTPase Der [Tissierellales bacterium]